MMTKRRNLLFLLLLAVFLAFALCACGTKTSQPQENDTQAEVPEPPQTDNAAAPAPENSQDALANAAVQGAGSLQLQVNDQTLTATWADNSSADALRELLADGPLTIQMSDYGSMEKVGSIGQDLPTNNEQITTEAGDLILYQGNAFVIYYAPNSWNFTRLGKINDITADELKGILGSGDVSVTLSLAAEE